MSVTLTTNVIAMLIALTLLVDTNASAVMDLEETVSVAEELIVDLLRVRKT